MMTFQFHFHSSSPTPSYYFTSKGNVCLVHMSTIWKLQRIANFSLFIFRGSAGEAVLPLPLKCYELTQGCYIRHLQKQEMCSLFIAQILCGSGTIILYFSKSTAIPSQRTSCFQESSKQCCYFCPRLPCILAPQKSFPFSGGFDVSINCIYVGLSPCLPVEISLRHFIVLIFHRQGTSWKILYLLPDLVSLLVWGFWAGGLSGLCL